MKISTLAAFVLSIAEPVFSSDDPQPGSIPGTTSHFVKLRDRHTYHYLDAKPNDESASKGTILLLHGLPDFSYGWRNQVPFLSALGYHVIVPDMLGYADTDAPCDLLHYAFKQSSADMAALLDVVAPGQQAIIIGHDWGAGLIYKIAMWFPEHLKAAFTLGVPYMPPWLGLSIKWEDLEVMVNDGRFPTLRYQFQFRDVAFDRNFTTKAQIQKLLDTIYGGTTSDGLHALSMDEGILYDRLPYIGPNPLLNATEMDFYVEKISQKGIRPSWNWYRTRRMDWEDELPLALKGDFRFRVPWTFVPVLKDGAVLPRYYENMHENFDQLNIAEGLNTSHWAMWEDPQGLNNRIKDFLADL